MSNSIRILVVDDDPKMRELIGRTLTRHIPNSSVLTFAHGNGLMEAVSLYKPQLVILDWILGHGKTGVGLCRELKLNASTKKISTLVISGQKITNKAQLTSIAWGADSYLAKPFSLKKLGERCRALIRKTGLDRGSAAEILQVGSLIINREERRVLDPEWRSERLPVKLFHLFWFLARHYPRPVPSQQLIRYLWKNVVRDSEAAVAVSRLKKYLDPGSCSIEWVAQRGYRLVVPN
ncbi:MAG: response regulator transcription factor [Elusimicrobia bacterium]|nr:response regulator transcription factor [Elusimicrobiota bacterium]